MTELEAGEGTHSQLNEVGAVEAKDGTQLHLRELERSSHKTGAMEAAEGTPLQLSELSHWRSEKLHPLTAEKTKTIKNR